MDELTVTLGAISLLLLFAGVGASPVAINRALGHLAGEALTEVVEDSEFVFAEQVRIRVGLQIVRDLGDGLFEICSDVRIEVAFGVAGDIDSSLVRQLTDAIDTNRVVVVGSAAAHCGRRDGDGVAVVQWFGRRRVARWRTWIGRCRNREDRHDCFSRNGMW